MRFAENPLQVIKNVKAKIQQISSSLPKKTLADGTISQVKIVPFYDRTQLIYETLDTLKRALSEEILVTIIIVVVMVNHLVSAALISLILPLAVLLTFIVMKFTGVDANIMALSGIAIAIGVMVDMGIILCENILRHIEHNPPEKSRFKIVHEAATEVGGAVITSASTTVIAFLPVFTLTGPEGKLFTPVALTKTFAIVSSLVLALSIIPPLAHLVFTKRNFRKGTLVIVYGLLAVAGAWIGYTLSWSIGLGVLFIAGLKFVSLFAPQSIRDRVPAILNIAVLVLVILLLTEHWLPLGPERGLVRNLIFCSAIIFGLLGIRKVFTGYYRQALTWALGRKALFLSVPISLIILGTVIWLGFDRVFSFIPTIAGRVGGWDNPSQSVQADNGPKTTSPAKKNSGMSSMPGMNMGTEASHPEVVLTGPIRSSRIWRTFSRLFPGLGKEFMPSLEEGTFLYMPTLMPHASIGEALDIIHKQNLAINSIPEVASVAGKIGRVESALDPAPISMIETTVNFLPEYKPIPSRVKWSLTPRLACPSGNGDRKSIHLTTFGMKSSKWLTFRRNNAPNSNQ